MRSRKSRLLAAAVLSSSLLLGCSGASDGPEPAALPDDLHTLLRGEDANSNGIRDAVEIATSAMAADMKERLRLLSYAWSLQQAMEVAMLGDDAAMTKIATHVADTTACALQTDTNPDIAQQLVDLYMLTVDSSIRKDASTRFQERTADFVYEKTPTPCAAADVLATQIIRASSAAMSQGPSKP